MEKVDDWNLCNMFLIGTELDASPLARLSNLLSSTSPPKDDKQQYEFLTWNEQCILLEQSSLKPF